MLRPAFLYQGTASARGISAGLAGAMVRLLVEGELVGTLRDGGDTADIHVRAAKRYTNNLDAIRALPVPSPRGLVALGEIASVEMGAGRTPACRRADRPRGRGGSRATQP